MNESKEVKGEGIKRFVETIQTKTNMQIKYVYYCVCILRLHTIMAL